MISVSYSIDFSQLYFEQMTQKLLACILVFLEAFILLSSRVTIMFKDTKYIYKKTIIVLYPYFIRIISLCQPCLSFYSFVLRTVLILSLLKVSYPLALREVLFLRYRTSHTCLMLFFSLSFHSYVLVRFIFLGSTSSVDRLLLFLFFFSLRPDEIHLVVWVFLLSIPLTVSTLDNSCSSSG